MGTFEARIGFTEIPFNILQSFHVVENSCPGGNGDYRIYSQFSKEIVRVAR